MAFKKSKTTKKNEPASADEVKKCILSIARKHFSLHGFFGTSLKDIASEAGVANSLINYHFQDKEGLFRSCMETLGRIRNEAIQRILGQPQNKDELRVRLELFMEEMIAAVMSDPHGFEIVDKEMRSGNPQILKLFEDTLLVTFKTVVSFFGEAQERGILREDVDPFVLASVLFTVTCDTARKDAVGKAFFNVSFAQEEWRRNYTRNVVNLFMQGVLK